MIALPESLVSALLIATGNRDTAARNTTAVKRVLKPQVFGQNRQEYQRALEWAPEQGDLKHLGGLVNMPEHEARAVLRNLLGAHRELK